MDRNIEDAVQDHKNTLLDEELERFMESAVGRKAKSDNWLNLR